MENKHPKYKAFQEYLKRHSRESVPSANTIATELGMRNAIPRIVEWLRAEGFEFVGGRWVRKQEHKP